MALIDVGQPVPRFEAQDHTGAQVGASALAGERYVLFFYPKDDSKDCTTQACEFSDAASQFAKAGVKVFGVSPDTLKDHQKFVAKHGLGVPLIVDERDAKGTPRVCDAFGVWQEKSMYGRKYMGVVRTTYVVGADGKVERRWDKVSVTGHVAAVLGYVRGEEMGVSEREVKKAARKTVKKPAKKPAKKPGKKAATKVAKRGKARTRK
ncbi:MAG: redoxin domain-containing protein [Tepidisphaera sp.]|nr:redoxin domain-containing protein [Tepidisphaera sp.]